jgi:membrane-bound inhibitor of C-type lysozyme
VRGQAAAVAGALAGLLIAGCGDQAKVAASAPAAPPRVSPAGPVNPDPGVTRYACADGEAITAGYPDGQTAIVSYKDHSYTLKLARSAEGMRYTGYGLQWWTRGDQASLSELKADEEVASRSGIACRSQAPPTDPVIRTSFAHLSDQRSVLKDRRSGVTDLQPI